MWSRLCLWFIVSIQGRPPATTTTHQHPLLDHEDNFSVSLLLLILLLHCFIVQIMTFPIEQRSNQQLMWWGEAQPLYFIIDFIMDQFQVEACVMIDQGQWRHYVQLFTRQHPYGYSLQSFLFQIQTKLRWSLNNNNIGAKVTMEEKPSSANFVLDRKPSSQDVTSNLPAKSTLKAASGE